MDNKTKKTLMSSASNEWCTPPDVVELIHKVGPIVLDPCSNMFARTKAKRSLMLPQDGLSVSWVNEGITYVNPPYGREQGAWVQKAKDTADAGGSVILLIPARTDTKLWQRVIFPHATAISFWKGRIKFVGATASAPFPSALILFGQNYKEQFMAACKGVGTTLTSEQLLQDVGEGIALRGTEVEVSDDSTEGREVFGSEEPSNETTFGVLRA